MAGDARALRLDVSIPTYRRPELLAITLEAVRKQIVELDRDGAFDARIVVIDNDPAASARQVVAAAAGPVVYVHQPRPGIAAARNAALDAGAASDLIAFIDDDEHPLEGWLSTLLDTWRRWPSMAVMGRVVSRFSSEPDPWIAAGDFFRRPRMPTGSSIRIAAAGNLLVDAGELRAYGIRFDERLGLGGGEDTLLSIAIGRAGGRIVWCDESIAEDLVPPERANREWLRQRFFSHGNNAVAVRLLAAESARGRIGVRVRAACAGAARVATGSAREAFGMLSGSLRHRARGTYTRRRGLGMITAAAGHTHLEYARESVEAP